MTAPKPGLIFACFLLFCMCCPFQPEAGSEILTADQVARHVFDRDRGQTSVSKAIMVLINKNGYKRTRIFNTTRIVDMDREKQLIRFISPEDIAGTGFLTIEKQDYSTDQFIYLSALRRTRRIAASQKDHRFVQSDFTYEDMERHPVENYLYKLLGEKKVGHMACYVLETRPKPSVTSQYALTKSLITKNGYVPILVDYFDPKGKHIKTYTVLKLEQKQGIWTESIIKMEDLKRSHQTLIKIQHIEYNREIESKKISVTALENF